MGSQWVVQTGQMNNNNSNKLLWKIPQSQYVLFSTSGRICYLDVLTLMLTLVNAVNCYLLGLGIIKISLWNCFGRNTQIVSCSRGYHSMNLWLDLSVLVSLREGDGTPLQYSCLENPMDGGVWCRLKSMGLLRVGHDWETSLSLFTFMHWRRKWQPTPVFLPGDSQGRRSLVGCPLWGRTESDTTEAT